MLSAGEDKIRIPKRPCKMASKKVGVLVRLRNMIPREAKLQLYKSAIFT